MFKTFEQVVAKLQYYKLWYQLNLSVKWFQISILIYIYIWKKGKVTALTCFISVAFDYINILLTWSVCACISWYIWWQFMLLSFLSYWWTRELRLWIFCFNVHISFEFGYFPIVMSLRSNANYTPLSTPDNKNFLYEPINIFSWWQFSLD